MSKTDDGIAIESGPLVGGTIGERIACARRRKQLTKSELGKSIGKGYRLVHKWELGEQSPDRDSLRLLAQVLEVSIEELLGVAEGQDPPYPAWKEFLGTSEGKALNPGERRTLQSIAWPPGREPTVHGYLMMLATIRSGTRERVQ